MEPQERPRAYSYIRWSTPDQGKGDSLRRQTAPAQAFAERHGLDLQDKTYEDAGVSAFHGKNLRGEESALASFIAAVRIEEIEEGSWLLLDDLSRFSRMAPIEALHELRQVCKLGITVATTSDNQVYTLERLDRDSGTAMNAFVRATINYQESLEKARKLREAWVGKRQGAAQEQQVLTEWCPGWLETDRLPANTRASQVERTFRVIEPRAEIVRRIFEEAAVGRGPHKIAKDLNRDGVPPFSGGGRKAARWHRSYVAKILGSPAVIGTLVPHTLVPKDPKDPDNGQKRRKALDPIEGYYPAVVSEGLFRRVQAMRATRSPKRGRHIGGPTRNLFGGLLKCSRCGGTVTRVTKTRTGGSKRTLEYLVCATAKAGGECRYQMLRYGDVEARFLGEAWDRVLDAGLLAQGGEEAIDAELDGVERAIEATLDAIEHVVGELERGGPSGILRGRLDMLEGDLEELKAQRQALWDRQAEVSSKLVERRLEELGASLGTLRETLEGAPDRMSVDRTEANTLLRQVFAEIVVDFSEQDRREAGAPQGRGGGNGPVALKCQFQHGGEPVDVVVAWPRSRKASMPRSSASMPRSSASMPKDRKKAR